MFRLADHLELGPTPARGGALVVALPHGRFVEVSPDAARLLRLIDGRRTVADISNALRAESATPLTAEQVVHLIERVFIPAGFIAGAELVPQAARPRARVRPAFTLIPATISDAIAGAFAWTFRPPVAVVAVFAIVAAHAWLFREGVLAALKRPLFDPLAWVPAILISLAATFPHEIGHAAALRSFGERPGAIGFTFTRWWPALFTDLGRAWMLAPGARVVVDLGGIYFHLLCASALVAIHAATGSDATARAVHLIDAVVIANLVPAGGRDGAWLLADLRALDPGAWRPRRWIARATTPLRSVAKILEIHVRLLARQRDRHSSAAVADVLLAATSGCDRSLPEVRRLVRRSLIASALADLDHRDLRHGARCRARVNDAPLRTLRRAGRGVIVCSMHVGPYFYVARELADMGFALNVFAQRNYERQWMPEWARVRSAHGIRFETLIAEERRSLFRAIEALGRGEAVLIYLDGQASVAGFGGGAHHRAVAEFLSVPIRVRTGAAYLSHRSGAPVVLAAVTRNALGRRTLTCSDPLPPPADDSTHTRLERTREMIAWFEPLVAPHPEQWRGWWWPRIHWEELGAAPTVERATLDTERARIKTLLIDGARAQLAADRREIACFEDNGDWTIVHGATHRVLHGDPVSCWLLESALRRVEVKRLRGRWGLDDDALSGELARLVLAGLARIESS